jgi:hypothetical protein
MIIFHETHRFELTVEPHYDAWVARLQEWAPGRLRPTPHLLRNFNTRQDAVDALLRKWRVLFPDEEPLTWREPVVTSNRPPSHRRRHPSSEDA